MLKPKLFLLSVLSLFVFLASISQAQEKKVLKFKKGEPFHWEMKNDLKLSDTQKKQFDDLDLQYEMKMIDLRAELEKSKLTKRELIKKDNFSKSDYLSAEEKILQAKNKIQMEKARLKMDKYSLLDEKQKKDFLEERELDLMFNFDMDGLKDNLRIMKEKIPHLVPCPERLESLEKEIEVEIEGEEI